MTPTRKQSIYIEIAERILPSLRNIQTYSLWRRFHYGVFYAELELVHNMAALLVDPELTNADAYWVGSQGRIYLKRGRRDLGIYPDVCSLIRELDQMIPQTMREKTGMPSLDS